MAFDSEHLLSITLNECTNLTWFSSLDRLDAHKL
jgi:hypothetical protein